MKKLAKTDDTHAVALATDVTALALPPPTYGLVPSWWNADGGVVPELDIEIWATSAVDLTNAELYGAIAHPLTFGDTVVTANATSNQLTSVGHGRLTGDGPCLLTGADVPDGTDTVTQYWTIYVDDDNVKLALSLKDALDGTFVDLLDAGSGTINLVDIPGDTQRVHWHSMGLLGAAGDGAISLTDQLSYWTTREHRPQVVAYAIAATLSGSVATSAQIRPVYDRA